MTLHILYGIDLCIISKMTTRKRNHDDTKIDVQFRKLRKLNHVETLAVETPLPSYYFVIDKRHCINVYDNNGVFIKRCSLPERVMNIIDLKNGYLALGMCYNVMIYDIAKNVATLVETPRYHIFHMIKLRDGRLAFTQKNSICVFDPRTKCQVELPAPYYLLILFETRTGWLISCSHEWVCVWDMSTHTRVQKKQIYCIKRVIEIECNVFLLIRRNRTHVIWNLEQQLVREVEYAQHNGLIVPLQNGQLACTFWNRIIVTIVDVEGKSTSILRGHTGTILYMVQLPDGRFVTSSIDKTIRVWNLQTNTSIELTNIGVVVQIIPLDNNRVALLSSKCSSMVRIMDFNNYSCVHMLQGYKFCESANRQKISTVTYETLPYLLKDLHNIVSSYV